MRKPRENFRSERTVPDIVKYVMSTVPDFRGDGTRGSKSIILSIRPHISIVIREYSASAIKVLCVCVS